MCHGIQVKVVSFLKYHIKMLQFFDSADHKYVTGLTIFRTVAEVLKYPSENLT